MSIYTLKRKTDASYRTASTRQVCFSLNGGHRSQGYVGQTSLPRTLMHGSNEYCENYDPTVSLEILDMNDSPIMKKSVISNRRRIAQRSLLNLDEARYSLNTQNTYIDTRCALHGTLVPTVRFVNPFATISFMCVNIQ